MFHHHHHHHRRPYRPPNYALRVAVLAVLVVLAIVYAATH